MGNVSLGWYFAYFGVVFRKFLQFFSSVSLFLVPGRCPLLCGGEAVSHQPPHYGLTVLAVRDGSQEVGVPDPLNVQRRTPAQVALGALGDLGQEGQPELLIPWKYFEGKYLEENILGSTCIWHGRWWICRRGISHHQLPSRSPAPANQSRNALMEEHESKQGRAGQVSLLLFYQRKWGGKYQENLFTFPDSLHLTSYTFIYYDFTYPQQVEGSEFYLLKFYINCLLFIQLHDRHVKGTHSEKFQPIQVCCSVPRTRTLNQDIENIKVLQFLIWSDQNITNYSPLMEYFYRFPTVWWLSVRITLPIILSQLPAGCPAE